MLVAGFSADVFGTNCYVAAVARGEECVIIDPGIGVTGRLDEVLAKHRLRPAAVVLTHGHLDHTYSVTPVCGARGVTAYIHPDDRELLTDPVKGLSTDLRDLLGGLLGEAAWTEPDDVAELADGMSITLAGLEFTVDHAPGHTRGSVLLRTQWTRDPVCFTGDVLFQGSVGRTDLPGGDAGMMWASLRDKILALADETVVLPGHGPKTTIGRERAGNPYLREVALGSAPTPGW